MVYFERALFIIGDQNTGKSTQLRSIFLDYRLHKDGQVPPGRNISDTYAISNERWLYLRLTSPHENEEDEQKFFDKIRRRTSPNETPARRWNFAGPLQLTPTAHLSAPETVIAAFEATFSPERIRAVILSPDRHGNWLAQARIDALVTSLRTIPRTETIVVDARHRTANGLIYADFFDFT